MPHARAAQVDPPQQRELLELCMYKCMDSSETYAVREAAASFLVNATAPPHMHKSTGGSSMHERSGLHGLGTRVSSLGGTSVSVGGKSVDLGENSMYSNRNALNMSTDSLTVHNKRLSCKKGFKRKEEGREAACVAKIEEFGTPCVYYTLLYSCMHVWKAKVWRKSILMHTGLCGFKERSVMVSVSFEALHNP